MAQINLLPWREHARELKKQKFFITLAVCVGATLFVALLIHIYYQDLVSYQDARNQFLQTEIAQKQTEINDLHKQIDQQALIEDKLQNIMLLRARSYRAVSLMNELLRIVPDSITLSKLVVEGNAVTLEGRAQSELAITAFLKSIAGVSIFNQPVLTGINSQADKNDNVMRVFQIKVDLKEPFKKEPILENKTKMKKKASDGTGS